MKLSAGLCKTSPEAPKGNVFNIQRFSLHDGPGIRSVVFFQGCHMRCAWCCNPESWAQARSTSTQSAITLDAVREEVARDVPYYLVSGGGVTLSGGEVMLQAPFARALLESLSAEGIHTAIETAGFAPWSVVKKVATACDLVLYDLKLADDVLHQTYTGVSNVIILRNLERLLELNIALQIRIPVIPGINDTPDEVNKMMGLISRLTANRPEFQGVCLLPYHPFGVHKYQQSGLTYPLFMHRKKSQEARLDRFTEAAKSLGITISTSGVIGA